MGNQIAYVKEQCQQCLMPSVNKKYEKEKMQQIQQFMDLSKNPSSDATAQLQQNKLSFSIENQDLSYDFAKDVKMFIEDGTSPGENQMTGPSNSEEIQQMNKKFVRPKDEDESLKKTQMQRVIHNTEESPMLQEEIKSEPSSDRSIYVKTSIKMLNFRDAESIEELGKEQLFRFKEKMLEDINYESICKFEKGEILDKYYLTADKTFIHQIKYKFELNTNLIKFKEFTKSASQQKSIHPAIESYEYLNEYDNCAIVLTRFKKILLIEPKEYLYTKYCEENDDVWYEVCQSIDIPEILSPTSSGSARPIQRGNILLSGIEAIQTSDKILAIEGYLEVDVKLMLNPSMTRKALVKESRETIERMKTYFNDETEC